MDVAADYQGRTVDVKPNPAERLLALQAELEKATGPRRVEIQKEIAALGKNSPSGTRTDRGERPPR